MHLKLQEAVVPNRALDTTTEQPTDSDPVCAPPHAAACTGFTMTCNCTQKNGFSMPISFNLMLTLNITRGGATLCKNSVAQANAVTGGCCKSGSSYAEGKGANSTAYCFRDLGTAFCGSSNWGTCLPVGRQQSVCLSSSFCVYTRLAGSLQHDWLWPH